VLPRSTSIGEVCRHGPCHSARSVKPDEFATIGEGEDEFATIGEGEDDGTILGWHHPVVADRPTGVTTQTLAPAGGVPRPHVPATTLIEALTPPDWVMFTEQGQEVLVAVVAIIGGLELLLQPAQMSALNIRSWMLRTFTTSPRLSMRAKKNM
jgi:hypothetical protein